MWRALTVWIFFGCALALGGCGEPSRAAPTPPAPPAPVAKPAPKPPMSPATAMLGRWKAEASALPSDPVERATLATLRLEFAADGAYRMGFGRHEQRGTWALGKAEGERLELRTSSKRDGHTLEQPLELELRGDDRLVLTSPDGVSTPMERAQSERSSDRPRRNRRFRPGAAQ